MQIDYTSYSSQAKSIRQQFIIIHYTASNFKEAIYHLTGNKVSAHYLIPTLNNIDKTYTNKKIVVYSLVPEEQISWHAGVSFWNNKINLNDISIGVEIVNQTTNNIFKPYAASQVEAIIGLCKQILAKYSAIKPTNILGHSDIAVGRKQDPGPLFPWEKLYVNGVGAWYDPQSYKKYKKKFINCLPKIDDVICKLHCYGYRYNGDPKILLQAFQMHFRQNDYSGKLDAETAAIAYALVDKYIADKNAKFYV